MCARRIASKGRHLFSGHWDNRALWEHTATMGWNFAFSQTRFAAQACLCNISALWHASGIFHSLHPNCPLRRNCFMRGYTRNGSTRKLAGYWALPFLWKAVVWENRDVDGILWKFNFDIMIRLRDFNISIVNFGIYLLWAEKMNGIFGNGMKHIFFYRI